MVNVKNIPIGSLVKITKLPVMILKDTNPLQRWDSWFRLNNLTTPLLVLDYKEGIDQIHGEFTKDIRTIFCTRLLVMAVETKFWIVLSSTDNVDAINLPDDIKDSFREITRLELIETENN